MTSGAGVRAAPENYRPCVGVAVFNRDGTVFVGRRVGAAAQSWWQMPQGGIDDGETARDAAQRELAEETGIHRVVLLGSTEDWISYDVPAALQPRSWGGRYRGQAQLWFAFAFTGAAEEIDLDASGHREFDAWRWVPLAETPSLVVAFKRPVYEEVARSFAHFAVPRRDRVQP
jgi:putative (di)nucleoside polyphosphate hydrolase